MIIIIFLIFYRIKVFSSLQTQKKKLYITSFFYLNLDIFNSNFSNLTFANSFFSISALTSFSGALLTKASFNNFLSNIAIYSFVSTICSFSLKISLSTSRALLVSTNTSTHDLIIQ